MFQAPQNRSPLLHDGTAWLKLKNEFDKIDPNLWRIRDDLYNFEDFAKRHPGGPDWIEMTRGTDITEAFEVAHVFGNKNKEKVMSIKVI